MKITKEQEVMQLRGAADIGYGYALRLIEWFGTAERAVEYLCADYETSGRLLSAAIEGVKPK